jgi:hypothetical protein
MKVSSALKLAVGAALFSPLLAVEDVLRHYKVMDVPQEGLFRNGDGKSIGAIWDEAGEQVRVERVAKMEVDALINRLKPAAQSDLMRPESAMRQTLKEMGIAYKED